MRLILVSGLSGSGKSVALNMLEDLDYYCVDNIPAALLKAFVSHTLSSAESVYRQVAVGLDARNTRAEIATVPALLAELRASGTPCELLFLTSSDAALLQRYAETRRRHPLSREGVALQDAIQLERDLLEPVAQAADVILDSSRMGIHQLRELVRKHAERDRAAQLSILFESFGFKHGIPGDADFVFDARSLPNPFWEPELRELNGRDAPVARYIEGTSHAAALARDITSFIEARIPEFQATNRRYMTVAIGCTGGQHRSVYLVEKLAADFAQRHGHIAARHSRFPDAQPAGTNAVRNA